MDNNILRRIFFDQYKSWERFNAKYGSRIRKVAEKEIEKFHHCVVAIHEMALDC